MITYPYTMTKTEILKALRTVRAVEAWVRVSDDDGAHVELTKAAVRRMFDGLAEDIDGEPLRYKARIQNHTLLIDA